MSVSPLLPSQVEIHQTLNDLQESVEEAERLEGGCHDNSLQSINECRVFKEKDVTSHATRSQETVRHAVMATSLALLALFRLAPTTQSVRIQNTGCKGVTGVKNSLYLHLNLLMRAM